MAGSGNHRKHGVDTRNARILKIFLACIAVFAAFVIGFFARGNELLLTKFGFSSLVASSDQNPGATVSGDTYDSLAARLAEVDGIVTGESLDFYDLDDATTLVLDAYTGTTDDKFLRYYNSDRYSTYLNEGPGKHAGIGVLFSEYEGQAYVVDVFERSAAELAGVKQGDFVVAIDGDRGQTWSATEVINALSRDEGETVIVTWRRPASLEAQGGEEFTTTLVCATASSVNVETEVSDGVGYVSLKQLTQNSSILIEQAINDLESQGVESYVFDLRNNPGGYLTQAVDTASHFIKSGVVVEIETKDGTSPKSVSGKTATDKPLIVLINENTASAAEVLAGALQDSGRAQVIGLTTMGKGSVQVTKTLTFGGALRYTAAYYKTPLGHDIQDIGIVPDVVVAQNEGDGLDNQKEFALDSARALISR